MPLLGFRGGAPGHHLFPPLSSLPLGASSTSLSSHLPLPPSAGLSFPRPPGFSGGTSSPPLTLRGCAVQPQLSPMTLAESRQGELVPVGKLIYLWFAVGAGGGDGETRASSSPPVSSSPSAVSSCSPPTSAPPPHTFTQAFSQPSPSQAK